jgi:hypothetical protein
MPAACCAPSCPNVVAEADALCTDEGKLIHAPATFERDWMDVQRRLREARDREIDEDGGIVAAPVLEWLEFAKRKKEARHAYIGAKLQRRVVWSTLAFCRSPRCNSRTGTWHR